MNELNIRRKRYDEAKIELDSFLNSSFMREHRRVKIIHGVGEGVLKKMTHELVNQCGFAKIVSCEMGMTVVELLIQQTT